MNIIANAFNKILPNKIQGHTKIIIHLDQVGFIREMQVWYCTCKSINIIHYIHRMKEKTHNHPIKIEKS